MSWTSGLATRDLSRTRNQCLTDLEIHVPGQADLMLVQACPEWLGCSARNCAYAQVKFMGTRENAVDRDFSSIGLEEEEEEALKEGAIISMGTEISSDDMANMISLCDQVHHFQIHAARLVMTAGMMRSLAYICMLPHPRERLKGKYSMEGKKQAAT